ncbi:Vacuolar protein sorting-associated protein 8, partial [Cladochytrium tenue]
MVRAGMFEEAISMGLGLYNGTIAKVSTGLPASASDRVKVVGDYLSELIVTYVRMAVSGHEEGVAPSQDDTRVFSAITKTCISACLTIEREDLILGDVYDLCNGVGLQWIFFEALEPYILSDQVKDIKNPALIQDLVATYESLGWNRRTEELILHLDPLFMDLNQLLRLFRDHELFNGLIYVCNRALRDFVTPIIELLSVVMKSLSVESLETDPTLSAVAQSQCYTLYVYLAYILTGKAYPTGFLGKREALQAKTDVYNFLFSEKHVRWPPDASDAPEVLFGDEPHPYLDVLIRYDSLEFCKALTAALDDPSLEGEIRTRSGHALDGRVRFADEHSEFNRQVIVDTLLGVLTKSDSPGVTHNLTENQRANLWVFIAKACAKYPVDVRLEGAARDSVLSNLITSSDELSHDDRQAAILPFVDGWLKRSETEVESVRLRCESAGLWKVVELIHQGQGHYDKILECYLNDNQRRREVFDCARKLFSNHNLTYPQTWQVKQAFLESLERFVAIDPIQTASIILDTFPADNANAMQRLEKTPRALFEYMRAVLAIEEIASDFAPPHRHGMSMKRASGANLLVQSLPQARGRPRSWAPGMLSLPGPSTPHAAAAMYNRLIELTVEFEPDSLLPFLRDLADRFDSDPYDLIAALEVARRGGSERTEPAALWLLERAGLISEAVGLLRSRLASDLDTWAAGPLGDRDANAYRRARERLTQAIDICRRSGPRVPPDELEDLWLKLLDDLLLRRASEG